MPDVLRDSLSLTGVIGIGCTSKVGHTPGQSKVNQDAAVMAYDDGTGSLLFGVFDGHGARGEDVSGVPAIGVV